MGATELSTSLGVAAPNYVFTAGLLHDVGKIVLGTFVEVDPAPILGLAFDQGLSFEEAEREVLGIDHAEVGAALLEHWGLPGPIAEAVRCHHHPAKVNGDPLVADLVHVADVLALMAGLGTGSDGLHYRPAAESLERLEVTNLVAETATCRMLGRLEELRGLFANALRG